MSIIKKKFKRALALFTTLAMMLGSLTSLTFVYASGAEGELNGEGTAQSPYQIGSEADYNLFAELLNEGNTKYIGSDKVFTLTNDLYLTEQPTIINSFSGTLDGQGHTILGLSMQGSIENISTYRLAMIIENTGTIKNLAVDTPNIIVTGGTKDSGPLVGVLTAKSANATFENCAIINANIQASGSDKAAGFAAENDGSTVTNCYFTGTVNAGLQPGAIFGYSKGSGTVVESCYIETVLTTNKYSGPVTAYPNRVKVYNTIVADGETTVTSNRDETFNGRLIGTYNKFKSNVFENNYVIEDYTINGVVAAGSDDPNSKFGKSVSEDEISTQSFYEDTLGWDFENVWKWEPSLGHPALKYIDVGHTPDRVSVTFYGDTSTQKGFTWYTEGKCEQPAVRISKTTGFDSALEFIPTATETENGWRYKAVASGLEADTEYYYQVGDKDSGKYSLVGSFKTAPKNGGFTFINLTDTQAKSSAEAQLSANTIAEALRTVDNAEFIVHSGDFVQTGADEQMWKDMLNFSKESMMNTTIVPAAGNHEYEQNVFYDHFNLETPNDQDYSTGVYYSFDYGNTHFVTLNTNENAAQAISDAQLEWLRQDVKAARQRGASWVILNLHKGVYTTATHIMDEDVKGLRKILIPVIDELDIDLVLQGHDHILARTKVLKYDEDGEAYGAVAETETFTEIKNGNRIEYAMNPDGTIYLVMNTAGAKHYEQSTDVEGLDMDKYLELFDRSEQNANAQHFAGITVTDTRLEVNIYQMITGAPAVEMDGFGIDREVTPVIEIINGLPSADEVTAADTDLVEEAYSAFLKLNDSQRTAVINKDKLLALIEKLYSMGQVGDTLIQWNDPTAETRQSIAVRNDTAKEFTDAPVLLKLQNIPSGTERNTLKFYSMNGLPLSYEIENWDPDNVSTVWVRIPKIPANDAVNIWAYFGGEEADNDPSDVWNDDYQLVDHFSTASKDAEMRTDSTGQHTGTVTGDITSVTAEDGTVGAYFENNKVDYGNVGGGYKALSISAVFTATEENLAKMTEETAALIARDAFDANASSNDTFFLGIDPDSKTAVSRYKGIWWENAAITSCESNDQSVPIDNNKHLLTMSYDGITVTLYIDGVCVYDSFVESHSTLLDADTSTVIGAYSDMDKVAGAFCGIIDEIQLTGNQVSAEWENFRYNNYFGDAVQYGKMVEKDTEELAISIAQPYTGAHLENGKTTVSGVINKPAEITAEINGETISCGNFDFGEFEFELPVNGIDEQELVLTAAFRDDKTENAEAAITLILTDEQAPAQPELSDLSSSGELHTQSNTLTLTVKTDDLEKLTAQFYQNELVTLNEENTVLYVGSTQEKLADAIRPGDGTKSDKLFTETSDENATPYQIYEISLTDAQASNDKFHIVWNGSTEREITAYVFDYAADGWSELAHAYNEETGAGTMDITVKNENILDGNKMYLLIWRGMRNDVAKRTDFRPSTGEYDFSFQIVPDTQLYAQSYPDRALTQFQWIADTFDSIKSKMVLSVGDVANRPYLNQEYQWQNMDAAYKILDDNNIPYAIGWGNHDYDREEPSNLILYKKYFSAERLKNSAGKYWGDSMDNDCAYYLMEEKGAKIMILTVGYWATEEEYEWAQNAIEEHPDYSVIIVTHMYVDRYGNLQGDQSLEFEAKLVEPYVNVKMVLNGHDHGSNIRYDVEGEGTAHEHIVWSLDTDYQRAPYGGGGYVRNMHIDLENDLVYFNTYSPIHDSTEFGFSRLPQTETPGMYKKNMEEFVIPVDFGGNTERSVRTDSLTISCGDAKPLGEAQNIVGSQSVSVDFEGLEMNTGYEWYAVLTDEAGHSTVSKTMQFFVSELDTSALKAAIENAEAIELSDYEEAGKAEFIAALEAAKAVLNNPNSTQAEVDSATAALNAAKDALKLITDDGGSDNNGSDGSGDSEDIDNNNDNNYSDVNSGNNDGNSSNGNGSGQNYSDAGSGNSDIPQTGDEGYTILFTVLLMTGAVAVIVAVILRHKFLIRKKH